MKETTPILWSSQATDLFLVVHVSDYVGESRDCPVRCTTKISMQRNAEDGLGLPWATINEPQRSMDKYTHLGEVEGLRPVSMPA